MIRYESLVPDPNDYNRLRRDAEWPEMDLSATEDGLPRSLCCACAFDGPRMVGMGRVVGDGRLCFYIQDVIVLKSHQRRGIGTEIMNRIMAYIGARAVRDSYLGLMAASGKEPFYARYGFVERPTETLGCGMTLFWGHDREGDLHSTPSEASA